MSKGSEDLQTALLHMLQRLKNASAGSRKEDDPILRPPIPMSLPHLKEKNDREKRGLKTNQLEEAAVTDKHTDPFSEAPINMISMAWVEKGKEKVTREEERRLVDKPIKGGLTCLNIQKPPYSKEGCCAVSANASVNSKYHPREPS